MTNIRRKRLMYVLLLLAGVAASVFFATQAMKENLMYFYSPTQVAAGEAPTAARYRLGGLVKTGSVTREEGSIEVRFILTDTKAEILVSFSGILPDLFREGQGIVAHGRMGTDADNGGLLFMADEVLAKHDENYMSPEVVEALKAAGHDPTKGNPTEYQRD